MQIRSSHNQTFYSRGFLVFGNGIPGSFQESFLYFAVCKGFQYGHIIPDKAVRKMNHSQIHFECQGFEYRFRRTSIQRLFPWFFRIRSLGAFLLNKQWVLEWYPCYRKITEEKISYNKDIIIIQYRQSISFVKYRQNMIVGYHAEIEVKFNSIILCYNI